MSKTVLAIDDELDTLTIFSEVLEDNNYTSITAVNGDERLINAQQ